MDLNPGYPDLKEVFPHPYSRLSGISISQEVPLLQRSLSFLRCNGGERSGCSGSPGQAEGEFSQLVKIERFS